MKADIKKLITACLRVGTVACAISFLVTLTPTVFDYHGALCDKIALLQRVPSPRVILVGGSSVAFGIDSEIIEQALKMPVINTGIHGGLGLSFMLDHVLPYVRVHDLIFVIPEYSVISNSGVTDDGMICRAVLSDVPDSLRNLLASDVLPVLRGFPSYASERVVVGPFIAFNRIFHRKPYYYRRSNFDGRGDEVAHLSQGNLPINFDIEFDPTIDRRVRRLNQFNDDVRRRGAVAVFFFPIIAESSVAPHRASVEAVRLRLRDTLRMPIAGDPDGGFQPDAFFFDTPYHANREGRRRNTSRILQQFSTVPEGCRSPSIPPP